MWGFITIRILLTFLTLFLVLTLIFILTKTMPVDPVLATMQSEDQGMETDGQTFNAKLYNQTAQNLRLDKPLFYFSLVPSNLPAEFYSYDLLQKEFALNIFYTYGRPNEIKSLLHKIERIIERDQQNYSPAINQLRSFSPDVESLSMIIKRALQENDDQDLADINEILDLLLNADSRKISPVPKIIWHGIDNQYHYWLFNTIVLDFGQSKQDGQAVAKKIYQALRWTLVINILSMIISYFLAIIIGVYAGWKGGSFDKFSGFILYAIYSIPVFWLATLLVVFFTTDEYGTWTNIFPAAGIWKASSSDSFLKIIIQNAGLFIIPVIALSTSLVAYIARILRNSIAEEKNRSYVMHARTKGLSEHYILWRHVFRNASFPLITILASVLPAALAGSLVVEVICNIPGSGRLLYDAISGQDWAIVNGVVMISAILTTFGILMSDILYRWVDPRVKWEKL